MGGTPDCQSCGKYLRPETGDEVVELRTTGTAGPTVSGGPFCRSCYADALADPGFSVVSVFKIGPKRVTYVPDPSYFSLEQCQYASDPLQRAE